MQNLRKKFPVLQQCIYANTAATGLLYEDLMEWRQENDLDYLIGGSHMKQKWYDKMSGVRSTVGQFFGCDSSHVALVPNFTLGLNLLLEGLPKTSKVLLVQNDYPSLNWPFESRNFERDYVKIDQNLEENIFERLRKGTYDVLALSLVQWISGVKMDLDFLKKVKEEHPDVLIIVDGTQFCGTERFDFSVSGIDILGASAYKWLLAGYGNGFFLVNEGATERFDLKAVGNWTVDRMGDSFENAPFCKRLEPGHLSSINFGSLQFSLEFLESIGRDSIGNQLQLLSQKAKREFTALGLLEETVVKRNDHSTIFNIKGGQSVFDKLIQNDVVCVLRGEGIRLSFHFYNTENEVDAIVDILKS
nr:aminotransferase class V-fold PLP-dependent enzyme [Allomuricauda sp.]